MTIIILEDYTQCGSNERTAGAFRNILEYYGINNPHTGKPFTESLLMGIGGGLGAEYATWAFKGLDPVKPRVAKLYLRFHHTKNYVKKDEKSAMQKIASRIGAKLTTHETLNADKGYNNLIESLQETKPVITLLTVWESLNSRREVKTFYDQDPNQFNTPLYGEHILTLPYYNLPIWWFNSHLVIVYGVNQDTNEVYLADWSAQPLRITLDELQIARSITKRIRNTTVTIDPPGKIANLEKAVTAGIRDCYQGLLNGYMGAVRVEAWEMMANQIANPKDKQGWFRLFDDPERLFDSLTRLYAQIAFFNCQGGALRSSYAEFLEEASQILNNPKLKESSFQFHEVARLWDDLAMATLPDSIADLKKTRLAILNWHHLFKSKGQKAKGQLEVEANKMQLIRTKFFESPTMTKSEALTLLESLSPYLHKIYTSEKACLQHLKRLV